MLKTERGYATTYAVAALVIPGVAGLAALAGLLPLTEVVFGLVVLTTSIALFAVSVIEATDGATSGAISRPGGNDD